MEACGNLQEHGTQDSTANSYAELAFTVLAAKAKAMLSAAQVPKDEHHKLWGETVMTATALDNLIPVT